MKTTATSAARVSLTALAVLAAFTLLVSSASGQFLSSGVLDPARAADWTKAGIPGGIPSDSWTQCGPTIAAYTGTSGTIQNAVKHTSVGYTGCGANTYVKLGAGTFSLSNGILLQGINNNELRGSGTTQTLIVPTGNSTCGHGLGSGMVCLDSNDSTYPGGVTTAVNWTAGYAQGSTQITVADSTGIIANSTVVVVDQCDDGLTGVPCAGTATDTGNYFNCQAAYNPVGPVGCSFNASVNAARANRGQEEMFEVTSCTPSCGNAGSTVLTLATPLIHPNWASARSPQIWLLQPSRYVGIRDLTIDGAAINYASGSWCLEFDADSYYWAYNVRVMNCANITIYSFLGFRGQWQSNYFYNSGQSNPATDNSAMNFFGGLNLFTNNICHNAHLCVGVNGPSSGNVVSYNLMLNAFTGNATMFATIFDGHSNGADYNLYEGNLAPSMIQDQAHGTHLMETWYRNFLTGWESCANGNCGVDPKKTDLLFAMGPLSFNRYGNFIGNVLGTPTISTVAYQFTNNQYYTSGTGTGYVWNVGSGNNASPGGGYAGGPIPIDPVVGTSIMRWGNWDAFNSATQWNTAEVPSGISVYPNPVPTATCTSLLACPVSFYLSSRPSWWASSVPFPAIGPDVSGGNVGQCTGTANTAGQYAKLPAISSGQCTGTGIASAWAGHVNAIPAMACYLNTLHGPPDGTGSVLAFDAVTCYGQTPTFAVNVQGNLKIQGNTVIK